MQSKSSQLEVKQKSTCHLTFGYINPHQITFLYFSSAHIFDHTRLIVPLHDQKIIPQRSLLIFCWGSLKSSDYYVAPAREP